MSDDAILKRVIDLFNEHTTGFVFAIPAVIMIGRDVVETLVPGGWRLSYTDNGRTVAAEDPDLDAAYLRLVAARLGLSLAAGGSAQVRCPSCDHEWRFHQPDGCWYTIGTVPRMANAVCPCSYYRSEVRLST